MRCRRACPGSCIAGGTVRPMSTDVAFASPAPGHWELDRSHYQGGVTPISQWLLEGLPNGQRRAMRALGVPAETVDVRFVHGFMYTRLRPLVRPDAPSATLPPLPLLKLLVRLHPEMRRRAKAADVSLRSGPWREVVADWHATTRPRLEARNRELQSVDLATLDDLALADHVGAVLQWCRETVELHFWLHAYDLGPLGLLAADCQRWGIPVREAVVALGGASPSTSGPARALAELRAEVEASGRTPTSLDDVRACSPRSAELLDAYLDRRGAMLITRYDLDGHTLGERPDTVLASIVHAPMHEVDHSPARAAADALRARVPAAEQAVFDQRLNDAREVMDLRDDNGPYTVEWPVGLLRLALLEVGRRAVAAGRLRDAAHALELAPTEAVRFARGDGGPSGDALAARAGQRRRDAELDPPLTLGPAEAQPPLSVLPAPLQTFVGAVEAILVHLGMAARPVGDVDGLRGAGVGDHAYTGTARLALDPEAALDAMEPGDVLVVRFTTPAYNTVLSLAGAVVTADGGPLCHAAVMARELGIPAVIGAPGALDAITDGARVEVDPVAGRVTVLS